LFDPSTLALRSTGSEKQANYMTGVLVIKVQDYFLMEVKHNLVLS